MTMMLVARALERIGDNAVDIGEQVAFVVTGLFREFSDASRVLSGRTRSAVPDCGMSYRTSACDHRVTGVRCARSPSMLRVC